MAPINKKQLGELDMLIDAMSIDQLETLKENIDGRIDNAKQARMDEFAAKMLKEAEQLGLRLEELAPKLGISVSTRKNGARAPVRAKYRGPKGDEWSGRGVQPSWMTAAIDAGLGKSKEDFLIKE